MDQGTRILDAFKRTDKGAPKGALKEARNRGWSPDRLKRTPQSCFLGSLIGALVI